MAVDASGGHPPASLGDGSRSVAQPPGCLLRVVCNRLVKAFTVCRSRIADYLFKVHKRDPAPSISVLDSPSVTPAEAGGERGDDGGKKVNGRKR